MRNQGVFKRLFSYMGPFRITMLLSIVLAALSAVLNLYAYVCVYQVGEQIVQASGDFSTLDVEAMTSLGWRAVGLIGASYGIYGIALLFSHITAFHTVARVRIRLIRHIGELSMGYHSTNPSGKQRKIIEKNTDSLETLIAHDIPNFTQSLTLPIAFFVFLFWYDWLLSLLCMLPIVIGFGTLAYMLKDSSEGFVKQYQKSAEDISNAATEYVRGVSVVKVFGQSADTFHRYRAAVKEYGDYMLKYAMSMQNTDSFYNTVIHGTFFVLIPAGILLFQHKGFPEGFLLSFLLFAILTPTMANILGRIMRSSSQVMLSKASVEAIDRIFAESPLPKTDHPLQPAHFDIRLDQVSFRYTDAGAKALDDVSLTAREGSVTALVGESGGGKTTIANLIARFWDVGEGAITVGGVDLRDMDHREWMKQVSIVFQDTSLFKMSILENVRLFSPESSDEEVLHALHLAQCDDILDKMPHGADTVIGTKGVYLSGGEMQRIALARAILKNAPVILLDEATAFADAENEFLIQKALDELLRGKTVIMIAHRLSTILHADQICVISQGKIVESGTHLELLAGEGVYADMFREYQSSISWKIGGLQHA